MAEKANGKCTHTINTAKHQLIYTS